MKSQATLALNQWFSVDYVDITRMYKNIVNDILKSES